MDETGDTPGSPPLLGAGALVLGRMNDVPASPQSLRNEIALCQQRQNSDPTALLIGLGLVGIWTHSKRIGFRQDINFRGISLGGNNTVPTSTYRFSFAAVALARIIIS